MKTHYYIFGMGNNGKELKNYLNSVWGIEVAAFIDNDENKWGEGAKIDDIECISIENAIKRGAKDDVIFVSVEKSTDIEEQLKELNFKHVFCTKAWMRKQRYLNRNRYFTPVVLKNTDYSMAVPFNHYESPYPDIIEIYRNETEIFQKNQKILNINFNVDRQIELLDKMKNIDLPEWSQEVNGSDFRYFYNNAWFGRGSAHALYYMMRILKPNNIIEVGSGYSTAVMLDTNEKYFDGKMNIISIEPRTDRLYSLLKKNDRIKICEKELQEMPLDYFEILGKNDILFIDSSHISKIGSDVNFLIFEIFPRLKAGVYIHFHDFYYPFIYPKEWIYEGRAYNEMYLVRAFLMNNKEFSVQFFGDMLQTKYHDIIPEKLHECGVGSLWIKKEI